MAWMLSYSAYVVAKYNTCMNEEGLKHYRVWHQLLRTCCNTLKDTTNFSAMRLLEIINPEKLGKSFALAWTKTEKGHSRALAVLKFLVVLVFGGILGFVAFTSKFSDVVQSLQPKLKTKEWSATLVINEFIILFGFINQIFGITRIWRVERQRLFLFIFGGEDPAMQAGEIDRQEAYLATVALVICQDLWVGARFKRLKRAVALLSLTDLTIQSLIIDEVECREVDASTIHEKLKLRRTEARGARYLEVRRASSGEVSHPPSASSFSSDSDLHSFAVHSEADASSVSFATFQQRGAADKPPQFCGTVALKKSPLLGVELFELPQMACGWRREQFANTQVPHEPNTQVPHEPRETRTVREQFAKTQAPGM